MTLDALVMLSGVFIALIPFLGFPLKIDNILLVVLGIFIIALGIIVRRRGLLHKSAVQKGKGAFVESMPRETAEPVSRGYPRAESGMHEAR